ncbi:hypothetical protein VHEMI02503 [[Torrubiella] hemipterigena]|uniref:NUDE domain-containing protein n=1 Tax=[Torrubiella] hemipterigena TaxID=1531966 RepID=A0A0A1SVY0_9HYPO|nr:hypothetical protein VHEMI02503 [[Torrubiella] hemipterigena]
MAEPPSSPPPASASAEDSLSWYKSQYEQLESELAEFRDSSRELEKELEKDIERAEKQERILKDKAETLGFQAEEWKRKYKEAKAEASSAQSNLEKEITTLRDTNRTLQLKLRDSEVANDDFERQARNTTSSLEDMESKYNQAIERSVIMEGEIKAGEQERETLRIESQRLRDELADLKIEAELMQDRIKKQEARHLSVISTDMSIMSSPTFDRHMDGSPGSTASSPLVTTPPEAKSVTSTATTDMSGSELTDPPSPPMSDASSSRPRQTPARLPGVSTLRRKTRLPSLDGSANLPGRQSLTAAATPKPRPRAPTTTARMPGARDSGAGFQRTPAASRSTANLRSAASSSTAPKPRLPSSNSLSHIRNLTAQMQRLEARVQSVRSRLPGPTSTPPRASPRSSAKDGTMPSSVTIRARKRTTGSSTTSSTRGDDTTPTNHSTTGHKSGHVPRLSTSGVSRLSFGPGPLPNRNPDADSSRPSSRASMSGYTRPASRTEMVPPPRPMSRSSISGARTPLGRPRSSMSLHGHSASVGYIDVGIEEEHEGQFRTPSRRGTYSKLELEGLTSAIPMPTSAIPTPGGRRQSASGAAGRRTSTGIPSRPGTSNGRALGDLGETY